MSYILSALFFACSIVCWLHVKKIIDDKAVMGVSLVPTFVFMATNLFEMFYFGRNGDWWTVAGAGSMFLSNIVWTIIVVYYKAKGFDNKLAEAFRDAPALALSA